MATSVSTARLRRSRAAAIPTAPGPSGLPTRRRWGRIGLGAAAAIAGAWIAAALVTSAGSRTEIIVLADDVAQFEVVERGDLRVARIATDPAVDTVAASDLDSIVGRIAATDLHAGSILASEQLVPAGQRLVADGEAIVGARLAPGDAPLRDLARGAAVLVVIRTPAGETGGPTTVEGWLLDLSEADATSGERSASIVVPRSEADEVAAAAGDKRVSIVALEE